MTGYAGPRRVRAADLVAKPWPNGRGITRDVVHHAHPDGTLDWMASIAELSEDAPFSHFPDCDRTFTLIAGGAVALDFPGDPALVCRPLAPALFPGDRPCACRLLGAPSRAFNIMADRRTRLAEVGVRTIAAGHATGLAGAADLVHCIEGTVTVPGLVLEAGDTALDVPSGVIAARGGPALVLVARVRPKAG